MPTPPDLKDRVAALERLVPNVPPIFHHLFALLPNPGEEFPQEKRIAFFRALSSLADLTYGPATIHIELCTNAKSSPPAEAEGE
jgi:hypothetical protein